MTIIEGSKKEIIYELRLSALELDVLLIQLQKGEPEKGAYGKTQEELVDFFKRLQAIRGGTGRLVKYGIMDSARLNWEK